MLYEFAIRGIVFAIRIGALFNAKAGAWINGRRKWRDRYRAGFQPVSRVLWVHAASLGEFEQGRPVIEAFRQQFPGWQLVLTFFSPSGYEIRKNYPHADFVCYLPADTRRNARDFIDIIQPDAAIFIKYEFWANYLAELNRRNTTTLLVSALFRKEQPFFQWYGRFWRNMLGCFTHFFVQNEGSEKLLQSIGFQNIKVAGDTRVDRVLHIAENAPENDLVAAFARAHQSEGVTVSHPLTTSRVFIAGSTWEADEAVFLPALSRLTVDQEWKIMIAPHDPSEENVERLGKFIGSGALRYSRATPALAREARVLIIDNVGLLNTLYRYGTVAYIGGGFGKGIHNTLEPAAFGLPVLFGPKYEKFEEARQFVERGGAFAVKNQAELEAVLQNLADPDFYGNASEAVRRYLEESRGATEQILSFLKQNMRENA
ncbi:MAG: 3-deoxy-D-manno-octulosonic acid transferase [Saprospiraceae bacterium]|nr:3-deoxy-D-manno-octulosonic acid transferase [Saprospiraceae bacterium]